MPQSLQWRPVACGSAPSLAFGDGHHVILGITLAAVPTPEAIVREQVKELYERHRVAPVEADSYYPPEMESEKDRFGMALTRVDGDHL